ncbi:membrane lipoprotein lipid attachment site-containing protein [candidate division WOR-3 bacterium]|nr:membrane lipoprotein lipid attachment site-containing protein [candidate division WOR-3 bacterium]
MKKIIFLITAFVLTACSAIKDFDRRGVYGGSLSEKDLKMIYEAWFERPYEYMFFAQDKDQMLLGGINGILYYGGLTDGFALLQGKSQSPGFFDLSLIEKTAKIPILIKHDEFGYYNPDIIIWGYENLLPPPGGNLGNSTYKEVYQRVFRRFFRMMAESYLYLQRNRDIDKDSGNYMTFVVSGRTDALKWLDNEYAQVLIEYDVENSYSYWTVGMSFGFWLRRHIDGTDVHVWEGLKRLMLLYDEEWFFEKLLG